MESPETAVPNEALDNSAPALGKTDRSDNTDRSDSDELTDLAQLESDLSAVEQAIKSLDEITARGEGGELAASQIAAAVSPDRFRVGE